MTAWKIWIGSLVILRPAFHYTANATTTTQKQSNYRVEQSSFTLIALSWLEIGRCRSHNWLNGNQALVSETPIKLSFGEFQIKLPKQLTIRCARKKLTKLNKAKHNCFDGFCEYKYCMVDWSITTELQIENILRKCQWLYIPKWLYLIFSPFSNCWKKLQFCQENGSASWFLQHSFFHW